MSSFKPVCAQGQGHAGTGKGQETAATKLEAYIWAGMVNGDQEKQQRARRGSVGKDKENQEQTKTVARRC